LANKNILGRMQQKHDTSANWALATTFIPLKGELIIYSDLNKFKIGDGVTVVESLPFATSDALPSQEGQAGKFLTTDGETASWGVPAGVPTIATYTGIIPQGSTSPITVNFTGSFAGTYTTDASGNIVTVDAQVGASSVTFTAAQAPATAITCNVLACSIMVSDVNGEEF